MTDEPPGQKVAVVMMRKCGLKLSYATLSAEEPLIGFIRRRDGHGTGSGMAYRTHSMLELKKDAYSAGHIAQLNNPSLFDWNADGVIYEGWVLEPAAEGKMRQVVQMWWIRNLEPMTAKPEIKLRRK